MSPQFAYRAKQGPDKVVDGVIDATSVDEAVEKLDQLGLLPVRVDELAASAKPKPTAPKIEPVPQPKVSSNAAVSAERKQKANLFGRVKPSEITVFARQLSTLIRAGVPILRALYIISDQTENPRFRQLIEHAQAEIKNGGSFSTVLGAYPKLFPPIFIAMVRTGEDSGTLQEALLRVSEYRQRQEEILARVRTAMAYPILMAVVGIGTVAFMLTFVIPRLSGLFSTMGGNLPMPTRILMSVSAIFQQKWFWVAAVALLAVAVAVAKTRASQLKILWSHLSLRLPVVRGFALKAELARFSRTLELLIKSGIPILRAIEITAPVLGNTVLRAHLVVTHGQVAGGASFGKSLKDAGVFPLFMTNLLSVGEESGRLDDTLGEIANFYERETDEAIKVMTSLLEPLMILVMGLIVGFIVIAMLLPMFELNMMVK